MKRKIALIGTGKLASALAPALVAGGCRLVSVTARTAASARRFGRALPRLQARTGTALPGRAELILLAVPDREIEAVAGQLAALCPDPGTVVLHHAGGLGTEPLSALREVGLATGVLHPLQVLGSAGSRLLRGSCARIEGDEPARRAALELAETLGMKPLRFRSRTGPEERAAYHAGAALASNDLVALISLGADLLVASGIGRNQAVEALASLAEGAIANLRDGGIRGAITGPVSRGDTATVRAHLARLDRASPRAGRVHRLLGLRILELAGNREPALERLLRGKGKR